MLSVRPDSEEQLPHPPARPHFHAPYSSPCYDSHAVFPSPAKLVPAAMLGTISLCLFSSPTAAQVPSPDAHFGFRMGADRRLVTVDAIEGYFEAVAAASNRVKIIEIGPTTDGHRTI